MISALIANEVGFEFVYASGYWLTASTYGLPDAGLVTYSQMHDRVAALCDTVNAGVIADADTGFGGLLNVAHTVKGYERAGCVAIQIEDQQFPKKCGHVGGRSVVPVADMIDRVKVAVDTREDMLVIARTDARQPESFERAVARGQAYAEAGADIVFVEALESQEEMRQAVKLIDAPLVANMANGGVSPILSASRLSELGFRMAIFPAMAALSAAHAVEMALTNLKQTGRSESVDVPHFSFDKMNKLLGFPEIHAFDARWKRLTKAQRQ